MGQKKEIKIPVIPGDGVGPELTAAAIKCLEALGKVTGTKFKFEEYLFGYAAYSRTGESLPKETLHGIKSSPVALLGAISSKDCPSPSPMGQLRKALGFFADIRHCKSIPGSLRPGIDLLIVRECSEGFLPDRNMYTGAGEFMPTPDVALSLRVITRGKSEQIAKIAYEFARKQGRKKVTVAHKRVVFTLGCGLFREQVFVEAQKYPEIETSEEHVDVLAGHLVTKPEQYDIIVTTNLFGDILSEVASAQVGNLAPIINASRENALFYPAHGPLNQLVGQQKINPMGMLYTVSMLLHWLDLQDESFTFDKALTKCITPELGSSLVLPDGITTANVVKAVLEYI